MSEIKNHEFHDDDFEFAQQAIRIGVAEYLLKPINYRELHEVIGKVCPEFLAAYLMRWDFINAVRKWILCYNFIRLVFIDTA